MNHNIKKVFVTVVTALSLAASVTACGGQVKGTCQACGREKPLYEVTLTASAFGLSDSRTHKLCKDCADATIKEAKKSASDNGLSFDYTMEKLK